mgnify:CR=1 FL=1
MSEHDDNITFIENAEDKPYLKTPLFNVCMRLFHASRHYRKVVLTACDHISYLCLAGLEGYKLPHGMSGANAGIPWNIIGIARNRGQPDAWCEIMINPVITARSKAMIESESNCGSIRLANPIRVQRHAWINVDWYDIKGVLHEGWLFDRNRGGLPIQHEVDHNNGCLITDRAV